MLFSLHRKNAVANWRWRDRDKSTRIMFALTLLVPIVVWSAARAILGGFAWYELKSADICADAVSLCGIFVAFYVLKRRLKENLRDLIDASYSCVVYYLNDRDYREMLLLNKPFELFLESEEIGAVREMGKSKGKNKMDDVHIEPLRAAVDTPNAMKFPYADVSNGDGRSREIIDVVRILVWGYTLYFYPFFVIAYNKNKMDGHIIPYRKVWLGDVDDYFFHKKKGRVPSDTELTGEKSWLYENEKGGRDKRFNENVEYLECAYGSVLLKVEFPTETREAEIIFSNTELKKRLQRAINQRKASVWMK